MCQRRQGTPVFPLTQYPDCFAFSYLASQVPIMLPAMAGRLPRQRSNHCRQVLSARDEPDIRNTHGNHADEGYT